MTPVQVGTRRWKPNRKSHSIRAGLNSSGATMAIAPRNERPKKGPSPPGRNQKFPAISAAHHVRVTVVAFLVSGKAWLIERDGVIRTIRSESVFRHLALCYWICVFPLVGPACPALAQTPADKEAELALDEAFERANSALNLENLELAAAIFEEIAEIATDSEDQALALNNACFLLNGLGRFTDSLSSCLRAVELRRESRSGFLVRSLNNLAVALQGSGDAPSAIASLREALPLNQHQEDWDGVIANRTNLAINYQTLGRFAAADRESLQALELCELYSAEEWAPTRCALTRMNRATLLERLGRYSEALDLLDGVIAGARLVPAARANAELNRGVIYRNLGDPSAARDSFDEAAALFREQGNRGGEASAILNVGLTRQRNLRDARGALDSLQQAADLAVAAGDTELTIEARYNLGRARLDLGLTSEAFATFTEALELAEKSGSGVGLWSSLAGLAAVDRAEGRFDRAVETLQRALEQIERQTQELSYQSSSSFLAERRIVYEAGIALNIQARGAGIDLPAQTSFDLVQRFKARALSDALGGGGSSAGDETKVMPNELRSHLGSATLIEYFAVEGRLLAFVVVGDDEAVPTMAIDLGVARDIEESIARIVGSMLAETAIPEPDLLELGMRLVVTPLAVSQGTTKAPDLPKSADPCSRWSSLVTTLGCSAFRGRSLSSVAATY